MTIYLPIFPNLRLFPGYSAHKKPTFATVAQAAPSGREVTRFEQLYSLWEFEFPFEILRDESQNSQKFAPVLGYTELQILSQFWLSRFGQYGAFIYQDPDDFCRVGQIIGVGTGGVDAYVMSRTWGSGVLQFTEPVGIVDVRLGVTLNVYLNGTLLAQAGNWWIDTDLRTLRFTTPPGAGVVISADFSFFYFCRFIEDNLDLEEFYTGRWTVKSLKFRSTTPDPPSIVKLGDVTFNPYVIDEQNPNIAPATGEPPPDLSLIAIDLQAGFSTDVATVIWDREGSVPNRLVTSFVNPGMVFLPNPPGSFSVSVHTSWRFTFGTGSHDHPILRIAVFGQSGTVSSPPYSGGTYVGADGGFGGGGRLSNTESILVLPRTPVTASDVTITIQVTDPGADANNFTFPQNVSDDAFKPPGGIIFSWWNT